jgi:DNA-directed RNA polymerase III subunit RPC3
MSFEATSTCLASRIAYLSFGSEVGEVASCLLLRGRLSFGDLARLNSSRLSPAAIRDCLIILLQQNCAWHAEVNGTEFFEANEEELLDRLRFGHYVKMAKDQWGEEVSSETFFLSMNLVWV